MICGLVLSLIFLMVVNNTYTLVLSMGLLIILYLTTMSMLVSGTEMLGSYSYEFIVMAMILLTLFVSMMSCLSSLNVLRQTSFNKMMVVINLMLLMSFSVSSFFLFFFFFESVLAPLLMLIVGWGYQPERLQAGSYMVIYTVFGSLFFLWGVSSLYMSGMSMSMSSVVSAVNKKMASLWWLYILGFLIKLPMYPFHLWLPKAHVEAPVAGSMLLAGVVLKLGGYGLVRLFSFVQVNLVSASYLGLLTVGMLGGAYAGMVCIRQVDLKCLVAYSSVAHMSVVLIGILSNTLLGVMGAVIIMVGHGLCSSGLFSYVNVVYKGSSSRLLVMNKGGLLVSPLLAFMSFLLSSSNMAAPPSLNLFGEVLVFGVSGWLSGAYLILLGLMSFLSACFSLYLYSSCSHGKGVMFNKSAKVSSFNDMFVLLAHWIPLNYLFMFMP